MSTPILTNATSRCWMATRDPTASETMIEQGNFWVNTQTTTMFFCSDAPNQTNLVWKQISTTN